MIMLGGQRFDLVLYLSLTLILSAVAYGLLMLVLSRREPAEWAPGRVNLQNLSPDAAYPYLVFVLPCLNEGRVIGASLERLLALDHELMHIVVIDDGSDDDTAAIVQAHADPRVTLLQRTLPNARQGKGEALNAAFRKIRNGEIVPHADPAGVVVCVVDADGRLDPETLDEVLPLFGDQRLGAVQIGVRINNRRKNLLARMQDLEFVLYTQIFQRGRRHFGSVGLGGNGQFVRLSALESLGSSPWTRKLAEDLDLGVRLLLTGWNTEFCSRVSVHQQGLTSMRRWIRQRTRWFQGHLQCWPLVPWILQDMRGKRRVDLLYHVTSPFLLIVGSLLTVAFGLWIIGLGVAIATGAVQFSLWWISSYLIAFGPAVLYGLVYWRIEREHGIRFITTFALMHLYTLYATLWYIAGWRAVVRIALGRSGWSKTERSNDDQEAQPEEGKEVARL